MHRSRVALLAGLLATAACGDHGTSPVVPRTLFGRYVAIGNSITAGVASEGINDSTQAFSYPVLLAAMANAGFQLAQLAQPGCPPPLTGPFPLTTERVGGGGAFFCSGFTQPIPTSPQNLAFPGFRIADALKVPDGVVGAVYNQVFHGRTLMKAMADAKPTLVSVWLGENDVLGAATGGDTTGMTPVADFAASVGAIAAAVAEAAPLDVVWIGVLDPQDAPIVQPGYYYWYAAMDPDLAPVLGRTVNASCSPLLASGEANPVGASPVSLDILRDEQVREISCSPAAPYVLDPAERAAISRRVADYNGLIRAAAEEHGWIYIDPATEIFGTALDDPALIRRCQRLSAASSEAEITAALRDSCPHPLAPAFFGDLVSYDGIHPSAQGQQRIAQAIAAALEARHGALR